MGVGKFLDPKNDFAFKKIFGTEKNKAILVHFLNVFFYPYNAPLTHEALSGAGPRGWRSARVSERCDNNADAGSNGLLCGLGIYSR